MGWSDTGSDSRWRRSRWHLGVKDYGEPLTFGIKEEEIVDFLAERGFTQIEPAGTEKLRQLYLTGVNAKRYMTPAIKLVQATVGSR